MKRIDTKVVLTRGGLLTLEDVTAARWISDALAKARFQEGDSVSIVLTSELDQAVFPCRAPTPEAIEPEGPFEWWICERSGWGPARVLARSVAGARAAAIDGEFKGLRPEDITVTRLDGVFPPKLRATDRVPGVGTRWGLEFRVKRTQEWVLAPTRGWVEVLSVDLIRREAVVKCSWDPLHKTRVRSFDTWTEAGNEYTCVEPYDRARNTVRVTR